MMLRSSAVLYRADPFRFDFLSPTGFQREDDHECRSFPGFALQADLSAMLPDDPIGDGESEPGAVRLGGEKGVEYLAESVRSNPFAGVGNRHFADPGWFILYGGKVKYPPLFHRLYSVQHQVGEDLAQLVGVPCDLCQFRCIIPCYGNSGEGDLVADLVENLVEHRVEVRVSQPPVFLAGELEEIGNDP